MTESLRQTLVFPPFRLPLDVDLLYLGDAVVPLEPQAVRVLRYLAQNHDRVVTKDEMLEQVWPDVFTTDGVLKKAISQARRALGDDADDARFIETYHGRGYRFIAPVKTVVKTTGPLPISADATPEHRETSPPDPDYDQLVGRDAELAVLNSEYRRTIEGAGRPVLVLGEPGIGKTLLARHFQNWASEQGALCLYARFFDYPASRLAPYEIFLHFLRTALGVKSLNELRDTLKSRFDVELPEELFVERGEETRAPRVRGSTGAFAGDNFRAVVPLSKCFVLLSREQPLVMIFDDLQWADSPSRDLIGYLMRSIETEALLTVGLVRRGGTIDPQHPLAEWMRLQANYRSYTSLTLRPLSEQACGAAIQAIFGGESLAPDPLPEDLRTLYRLTGGNPYFLTEMLRLLVTEGAIAWGGPAKPRWHWKGLSDLQLPETIVMAAQNKLDRLSPTVREIIEQASVIGVEFRVDVLADMSGRSEDEIVELLDEAVRRGVLSDRGLLAGEDYRFYHAMLRRVLYNNLPPRLRRELHARAARSLEKAYAQEPDRIAGSLSNHYEVAREPEETFAWSMRAWQAARARWNWTDAVQCLERAQRSLESVSNTEGNSVDRLTMLLGLGEAYSSVARIREADIALNEALALADTLDYKAAKAAVLLQQGQTRIGLSLYREANDLTKQALEIYREVQDSEGEVLARIQLGAGEVAMGNYAGVSPLVTILEREHPPGPVGVIAWGLVGWAHVLQGRYAEGIAALQRALEEQERSGDLRQRALVERRLAWAQLNRGQYDKALELAFKAREDFRRVGDMLGEAQANLAIGLSRIAQGAYQEAQEHISRTLDNMRVLGDAHCEAETLWALGRAHSEAGQSEQAAVLFQRSLEMLRVIGDRDDELRVLVDLARLRSVEGNAEAAEEVANDAVKIAESLGSRDGFGLALLERARARIALDDLTAGHADAEQSVSLLEASGSGELWRADSVLASCRGINPARAEALLRRAVVLLSGMRDQIDPQDVSRRTAFLNARNGVARQLHTFLTTSQKSEEAEALAAEWFS
jgi:DNA-binding winged helix-turn-helix (wHTH) protein/tetratricopeptide (TPR) repeat protein